MTNTEIAKVLSDMASAYTIIDEKKYRFQIIAYKKASEAIEHTNTELRELAQENKLDNLNGVGPSIKSHIEEILKTGKVQHFNKVLSKIPATVFPLLDIPGFGPKKAFKLVSEFQLNNPETVISDLAIIANKGKIASLDSFGEKSQADIIQAIREYELGKTKSSRMVLSYANELSNKIINYLNKSKFVLDAKTLGSLRRKRETVGDIDIAVSSKNPSEVLDHFVAYPHAERVVEKGVRTATILTSGNKQIDLMVESPDGFGALLQHFTGSRNHNIKFREIALSKGYSLSDYGVRKKIDSKKKLIRFKTEKELYNFFGLTFITPELRENLGELELAQNNNLPKLIEKEDILGDFHIHSSYPIEPSHDMGQNSMQEMLDYAKKLKYKYLGFSEHNPSSSKHTKEEVYKILSKRSKYIERLRLKNKNFIHIFSLIETDILPNGKLALDDKSLSLLDGSIVSIHSSFNMSRREMTKRVLNALSHPKAKILAHPTGRLINQRKGYDLDWSKVFDFCFKNNKALEINSWPYRLDLPDILIKEAITHGVKLIINTDSHATDHMNLMQYGVSIARRGWATNSDIINTWEYNKVNEWFTN